MPKERYPTIRVSPQTYEVLSRLKAFLMEQEGCNQSYDDVINFLFLVAKPHRQDFPYWPVFQEKESELEKRRKRFWREFRRSSPGKQSA
jgi:hypothetical protein